MKILISIILSAIFVANTAQANNLGFLSGYKNSNEPKFAHQKDAFKFSSKREENTVILTWIILDKYYMYRDKIKIKVKNNQDGIFKKLTNKNYSHTTNHVIKFDEGFEKDMHVFYEIMEIEIENHNYYEIKVQSQGCAEKGFCYAPHEEIIK